MSGPSRARDFVFTLVALVALPALALLALEGALRLAGFGFDPDFFVARDVDGRPMWSENPHFGWRFFPKDVARGPERFLIARPKPEGVVRVCVLGESAAMGDPAPAYGIPRMLRAHLEAARPELRFEVVNAAMTAINSHVIREIARDCLEREADFLVVYAGNNEVVGPFGAGSIFGVPGADRAMIRALVALRSTRVGQLLDAFVARLRPAPSAWTGMEQFTGTRLAFEDPRLTRVVSAYRENLEDICRRASEAGVPVLLCTVAVNLLDCAPFGSEEPAAEDGAAWQRLVAAGDTALASGDTSAALAFWSEAQALDARPAELS